LLPRKHRKRAIIELAIGTEAEGEFKLERAEKLRNRPIFRVLYVGQFLYWKGMHLGIPAFAQLAKTRRDARLTIIGEGPERARWQKLAERHGVAAQIDWREWLPQAELAGHYDSHHVLLFPSLHDSGGLVVLESLARGLPVVCLKIGGPGTIVTPDCGRLVDAASKSPSKVIAELGRALIELTADDARLRLSRGAQQRSRDFRWQEKVARVYREVA
jgi:glycosyltransferase involved in cell wall biosynthesis